MQISQCEPILKYFLLYESHIVIQRKIKVLKGVGPKGAQFPFVKFSIHVKHLFKID